MHLLKHLLEHPRQRPSLLFVLGAQPTCFASKQRHLAAGQHRMLPPRAVVVVVVVLLVLAPRVRRQPGMQQLARLRLKHGTRAAVVCWAQAKQAKQVVATALAQVSRYGVLSEPTRVQRRRQGPTQLRRQPALQA